MRDRPIIRQYMSVWTVYDVDNEPLASFYDYNHANAFARWIYITD